MILIKKIFLTTTYLLLTKHSTQYTALAINRLCSKSTISLSTTPASTTCSTQDSLNMSETEFKYESGTSSVAFVTAPDEKIAKKLAHGLVERKLAACVNIMPNIQSVYMWEGKINEDNEYLMMIKTRTSRLEELTKWVRDNHPYSVAEVITLPIEQGNLPYMKWMAESVPDKN